ncbi:unnamed protein product [Camellia sinensis]
MDIDSNNNSFNGNEKVEEEDNNLSINESGEVEEPNKGAAKSTLLFSFYGWHTRQYVCTDAATSTLIFYLYGWHTRLYIYTGTG